MLESHKNTALNAAILCPAFCIHDIMNNADMCEKSSWSASTDQDNDFCSKLVKEWIMPWEAKFEAKKYCFYF